MKEFIKGIHITKEDKLEESEKYLIYQRNKYQSKAFQGGVLSGLTGVFIYLKRARFNQTRFSKLIYSINLFTAIHVFVYEIWNRMYTDREKVIMLDNKLLKYS